MNLKSPHYIGVNTTKILCKPNCKDLTKVAESNKIVFTTIAEAHAKNFIKCSKCFYKSSKILRDNLLKAELKSIMETPIGQLTFLFHNNSLSQILFDNDKDLLAETRPIPLNNNYPSFQIVENLFTKYFKKEKVDFTNIPISITGTSFQQQVFKGLSYIQYGKTLSYKSFSEKYFKPSQLRAVSSQIGKNPLPIIFPCHRVIGSNNSLTGFLGGLDKKQKLLALEGNSNTWK